MGAVHFGIGPVGAYIAGLDPERRDRLREALSRGAAGRAVRAHGAGLDGPRPRLGMELDDFAAERSSSPGVLLRLVPDAPRIWDLSAILPA